jgi:hypothetical protein
MQKDGVHRTPTPFAGVNDVKLEREKVIGALLATCHPAHRRPHRLALLIVGHKKLWKHQFTMHEHN